MCYAGTSNVRRYYENVKLPDRLFVLGDSAAAFNPVRSPLPFIMTPVVMPNSHTFSMATCGMISGQSATLT